MRLRVGNLTTAFRILDAAARRGHDINVFAYEGAAAIAFAPQMPHPTPCTAKTSPKRTILRPRIRSLALLIEAGKHGGKVDWVNCGMCVDELAAVYQFVSGTQRGSPAIPWPSPKLPDNTRVIPNQARPWPKSY